MSIFIVSEYPYPQMSNVLITGGLSLIGSNYINYSLSNGRYKTIVNIDMVQFPGTEYNISKRDDPSYVFIRGDMGDMDLVSDILTRYDIDYVIHIAAFSHVDKSFDDPLSFTENNVLGTHKLIEACRKYGRVKKFIHFGTDEVYGEVDINHPGCKETESLDPTNPYSGSKAAAEMIVSSYYHSFDFPVVTIRCNNVFGPNQYPEKLIPRFIMLLKEGKKLTIHGDGRYRRNFIHTLDVSRAIDTVLDKGVLGEVYNIGCEDEYSVMDIAHILIKDIKGEDPSLHIEYVSDRPFNDFRYNIDTSKIRALGWNKEEDFISRLRELY